MSCATRTIWKLARHGAPWEHATCAAAIQKPTFLSAIDRSKINVCAGQHIHVIPTHETEDILHVDLSICAPIDLFRDLMPGLSNINGRAFTT